MHFFHQLKDALSQKKSNIHVYTLLNSSNAEIMLHPKPIWNKEDELHCDHGDLRGVLGLFVQALLAFLAFTSLIGKFFSFLNLRLTFYVYYHLCKCNLFSYDL